MWNWCPISDGTLLVAWFIYCSCITLKLQKCHLQNCYQSIRVIFLITFAVNISCLNNAWRCGYPLQKDTKKSSIRKLQVERVSKDHCIFDENDMENLDDLEDLAESRPSLSSPSRPKILFHYFVILIWEKKPTTSIRTNNIQGVFFNWDPP